MKKYLIIFSALILIVFLFYAGKSTDFEKNIDSEKSKKNYSLKIEQVKSTVDKDKDGIDDYTEILLNARNQIGRVTKYNTSYYSSAYPPEDSGACSDVIWRAFKNTGYDFKKMLDEDIKKNQKNYSNIKTPDPNIDFRRVRNIRTFLEKNTKKLTNSVKPWDEKNLKQWQGGDIVTYDQIPGRLWHIAIVSDKRRKDGVPLIIHNYGGGVKEDDYLLNWPAKITGHYRFDLN